MIEAVRLALEIIELRRARKLTEKQASALIEALKLPVAVSAEADS